MTYLELKQLVQKHCHLYYDLSAPEISDAEFDSLYSQLELVEEKQGWADYDSPTSNIGGKKGKIKHPYKLYSLRKVYDMAEVDPEFSVKTPKIDGANVTLVYRFGKLKLALTRGNGESGDNITHLAVNINNIPTYIDTMYEEIVLNGECVTDNKVENFRNYTSGALGLKSSEEFKERNIAFIAHDWLGVQLSYTKRMDIIKKAGFTTVFCEQANKYPHDGVVYRVDSYSESVKAGYTAKYPKFAVALKPRGALTAISTLIDVEWNIGRTGTVNPTGVIEPVILDDAKITRITLHNLDIIEEHNLGLGDTIVVERAGGVIPKFIKVEAHSKHNIKIDKLHAEKAVGQKLIKQGPKLYIIDKSKVDNNKMIEHFVKTMEIKGFGPAYIEKTGIKHPQQLYGFQNWSMLGANGFKIKEEVDRSKNKPYNLVLAALGVPGVGKSTAKQIVLKLPRFIDLEQIQNTAIKGIGPITKQKILSWYEDNKDWVLKLPLQLEEHNSVADIISGSAKKVCITGTLDMTRKDLQSILEDKGYTVTSTVTKDCYALIFNGETSSSKYKKAVQNGVQTIDYWKNKKDILNGLL